MGVVNIPGKRQKNKHPKRYKLTEVFTSKKKKNHGRTVRNAQQKVNKTKQTTGSCREYERGLTKKTGRISKLCNVYSKRKRSRKNALVEGVWQAAKKIRFKSKGKDKIKTVGNSGKRVLNIERSRKGGGLRERQMSKAREGGYRVKMDEVTK